MHCGPTHPDPISQVFQPPPKVRSPSSKHRHHITSSRKFNSLDEPPATANSLRIPIQLNYTSLRAPRQSAAGDVDVATAKIWLPMFHGDDPSRWPFRRSLQLSVRKEKPPAPEPTIRVRPRASFSLFQRSIRSDRNVIV
jgi:hypothetical protein